MNAIITFLQKKGYLTVDSDFYSKIDEWIDWYKCNIDDFHKSSFFNGVCEVENNVAQLGMAKTVCENWANLLLNEKVEIRQTSESCQKIVDEVLKRNNFRLRANQLIETSFAYGTGAFVEFIKDGKTAIDYVNADKIFPLKWENGEIIECAFGSVVVVNAKKMFFVNIHTKPKDTYVVENYYFEMIKDEIIINQVDGVENWDTKSYKPMFQIIKPSIVNNYDDSCPLGISVYANALDVLKGIDLAFDSFVNEFPTGRRMVFLKSQLFGYDKDGKELNVISRKENILRWLPDNDDNGKELVKDFSPDLRADAHIAGIQGMLNLLSQKCGFGSNYFEFTKSGVKTATEVISEDSDLYDNLKKHELALEGSIKDLMEAILFIEGACACETTIDFDDSIIEDTDNLKKQALIEYNAGLIDKVEYFVITRKLSKEQAINYVDELNARAPTPQAEPPIEE